MFLDKRNKNTNAGSKVLQKVLVYVISVLFVIFTGYYSLYYIKVNTIDNVINLLESYKNKEILYVIDKEPITVLEGQYDLSPYVTDLIKYSNRSLYFNKVNKGSEYVIIHTSGKYKIELYPFNDSSVLMKVNRRKGIDVTYLLEDYGFDMYCDAFYEISGYRVLRNDYQDISTEKKDELLSSALTSLSDKESLCTMINIDNKNFYRYKDVYGHSSIDLSSRVYYKEGYLLLEIIKRTSIELSMILIKSYSCKRKQIILI